MYHTESVMTFRQKLKRLKEDSRGESGASRAVDVVVSLMVAALMAAYLLPMAINEIASVDTTSWANGASELWNLLPVMIVLSIFLFFVGLALARADSGGV